MSKFVDRKARKCESGRCKPAVTGSAKKTLIEKLIKGRKIIKRPQTR